jgi:hypothetical protein
MHVDFKVTSWERVEIPKEHEEKVLSNIKKGLITSANDLFSLQVNEGEYMELNYNKLDDTDSQMSVKENGGSSTIEVWENDSLDSNRNPMKMTWKNGNDH